MDPVLALDPATVEVDPGGEARVRVTVRNDGDLIEQYRFEVLGDAARWAQVVPPSVSALPHGAEEKSVEVVFRPPPPPTAPAGRVAFGIRCVSLERRDRCAVVEGDVSVGAVHDLTARLVAVSPSGRWTGRYRAEFDNTGTVPVTLSLTATDEKRRLGFALAPTELTVAPGRSETAYVAVRPTQPLLRGRAVPHGFSVGYRATGPGRGDGPGAGGALPGSYEQRPVLSKGVVALGMLLVVAVVAGGVLLGRRTGDDGAVRASDGPPPPTALVTAAPLAAGSIQLVWQASPYAKGYVVQQMQGNGVVAGAKEVTEPDQSTLVWDGLKPGRACFRVVTVGTSGRSAPSESRCAAVAAPPSASASPTPEPTPTPTPAPTTPPGTTPTPDPSGPSGGPTGGPTGGPAGTLRGTYVIYATYLLSDPALRTQADALVARLQQAGSDAQLVSSLDYPQIPDSAGGLLVVVEDGFAGLTEAKAACAERRSVAPNCYAQRGGS